MVIEDAPIRKKLKQFLRDILCSGDESGNEQDIVIHDAKLDTVVRKLEGFISSDPNLKTKVNEALHKEKVNKRNSTIKMLNREISERDGIIKYLESKIEQMGKE